MCSRLDVVTKENLTHELKRLQEKCLDTCITIENSPLDANITLNNIEHKSLCYVDGLRTQIQNSETSIPTDENLIINQVIAELKEKTEEVKKLNVYSQGTIIDIQRETQRLNTHTRMAEEALTQPSNNEHNVLIEQISKTKETFRMLKTELHKLIKSIFRKDSDLIVDVTAQLMTERLTEESSGYISVTEQNIRIIELLKDIKIVSTNPYNDMEVKLAY